MAKQFIYPFTFGDKSKSDLLGGKGANLAEMVQMGLPVPPGFTITTDACREFLTTGVVPTALNEKNIEEVSIILPDGNEYSKKGKINFAASEINPALGTQELRATFENNEHQILPGQFVRVRVTTGKKDGVFVLPQLAVLNSDQGKFVFVVNEKNQATPRPVITGEWKGKDWVILGGLQAGDKVIIDNLIKVRPGMSVTNMPNFKK